MGMFLSTKSSGFVFFCSHTQRRHTQMEEEFLRKSPAFLTAWLSMTNLIAETLKGLYSASSQGLCIHDPTDSDSSPAEVAERITAAS